LQSGLVQNEIVEGIHIWHRAESSRGYEISRQFDRWSDKQCSYQFVGDDLLFIIQQKETQGFSWHANLSEVFFYCC